MASPDTPDIDSPEFMKRINEHPAIAQILRTAAMVDAGEITPDEGMKRMEREIGKIGP